MNARESKRMISSVVWQSNIRMWKYISYPVTVTSCSWSIRQRMSIWWKRVSRKWRSWMRQSWRKAWELYRHRLLIWRRWWGILRITYRVWRALVRRRHWSFWVNMKPWITCMRISMKSRASWRKSWKRIRKRHFYPSILRPSRWMLKFRCLLRIWCWRSRGKRCMSSSWNMKWRALWRIPWTPERWKRKAAARSWSRFRLIFYRMGHWCMPMWIMKAIMMPSCMALPSVCRIARNT